MFHLAFNRSANRTCACASTTVDALIFVDHVCTVASSDSFCRTFVKTSSTANACIIDFISHCKYLL